MLLSITESLQLVTDYLHGDQHFSPQATVQYQFEGEKVLEDPLLKRLLIGYLGMLALVLFICFLVGLLHEH